MCGCSKDCLILILFKVPQISCFTLSLFLFWLRELPQCGYRTPASVPPPAEGRSSPTNTPVFPPSSFILLWFYIHFSIGQVLLSALSWCSACTSEDEGVFLMYHGERYTPSPPIPPPSLTVGYFVLCYSFPLNYFSLFTDFSNFHFTFIYLYPLTCGRISSLFAPTTLLSWLGKSTHPWCNLDSGSTRVFWCFVGHLNKKGQGA